MAKEKSEPIFEEPEFNELEFLKDEKDRAKSVIFIFLIGALLGLFSGYLFILGIWYLAVLLFLVLLIFFKHVLKFLRIPFPKRASHWIYLVGEFMLTWVVFWIIFLNPPISAVSGPQIGTPQYIIASTGNWQNLNSTGSNIYSAVSSSLSLRVSVTFIYAVTSYTVVENSINRLASNYNGGFLYFNVTGIGYSQIMYITVTVSGHGLSNSRTFGIEKAIVSP
ncbi:MAG: hypothetical protein AAE977_05880 [Thermoplasmataceae archaeon]|jgi:hypothetical protein